MRIRFDFPCFFPEYMVICSNENYAYFIKEGLHEALSGNDCDVLCLVWHSDG